MTVNRYANVTVPTCQTGGQAAHKDPSSPLHFYSPLPFMIFNSLFFFPFLNSPPSFFRASFPFPLTGLFLAAISQFTFRFFYRCCFSISPWLHRHNGADVVHVLKLQLEILKKGSFRWKLTRFDLFAGEFCSDKLVYVISVLLSSLSLPLSASSCILPLTPALPPLPLKCLLPYIDRAVWHGQGIVVHEEIPLMAYVCVEGCVWIRLCIKSKVYFIFFPIPSCSLVWERRGQWEHSRVAVCAAMHVYKCVFCVNVCVCCKWLPVTAVIRTRQNQSCTKLRKITIGMAES